MKKTYVAYYRAVPYDRVRGQKDAVKQWCKKKRITPTREYENLEIEEMLGAAEAGEFNVLVIHSLPAIFHNTYAMVSIMINLHDWGVTLMTATGNQLKGLDSILPEFKRVLTNERNLLIGRTKAGIARARAAGKRIGGQPQNNTAKLKKAKKLREQGLSYEIIARKVKLSAATVYYHLNPDKKKRKA